MTPLPDDDFATRRRILSANIARQRGELFEAYKNLEKPIHYAEYGLRGFGFLRKNPWVFVAVPAVFSMASTLLGFGKKKSARISPSQQQGIEYRPKGIGKHVVKLGGYGWKLFQFYRRVRPYFP